MIRRASLALLVSALAMCVPSRSDAQGGSSETPARLSFDEASRRTLEQRPELRALALDLESAAARRERAGLRPPLELGADAEGIAGGGAYRGVDAAELTVSLGSVFERAGRREARIAVVDREIELLGADRRVLALDLLAETGRRFVAVGAARARLDLSLRAVEQARRTVELIGPRVRAARSPRTELLNAELQLAEAELARDAAARELQAAQVELGAQWNDLEARPEVALALLDVPAPASFDSLSARLDQVPDLARYAVEARLREAELRLARSQARADVRWSVGVRRYQEPGEQALVAGFSVPLSAARRNVALEREAEFARRSVDERAAASRLELRPLLHRQLQLLATARARVLSATEVALPRAREALELTERGYRIGRFPYRELALAQAQVLDLEAARLDAATEYHLTTIEIERLTGARLTLLAE